MSFNSFGDGFDKMFSFPKSDISEWNSKYVPKNN